MNGPRPSRAAVATGVAGVTMLRAGNRSPMTLDGTRTFVIGAEHPVVVDPGPAEPAHLETLLAQLEGRAPVAILLTHAHSDHAGCAADLAARTGAPLRMGRGAPRLPFDASSVAAWLEDGEHLRTEVGPIEAHATPGHAPEHFAFLLRAADDQRALFAGDLFLGAGDTTLVSAPHGNVAQYLHSLERVLLLEPTVILPAHGRPLRHPRRTLERYRQHRMDRLDEVRRALEIDPAAGAEELVEMVYGSGLDPRLHGAALGSVGAMIEYLGAAPQGEEKKPPTNRDAAQLEAGGPANHGGRESEPGDAASSAGA